MALRPFLDELRRRRVVRVAVVYGAVLFAVLQAADLTFPRVGLPDWAVTLVLMLGLLGFPVALALAWAFDLTTHGLRRTEEAPTAGAPRPALLGPMTLIAAAALVTLGLTGGWWLAPRAELEGTAPEPGTEAIRSVAVIPFANFSDDASNEYFSDGLAEELLNVLAQVEGLKVAARTSSWVFKGRSADVKEIAATLGVQAVVEGSVRRQGDRVRVTAQLIQASDGFHLWSHTYDSRMEDVFALQDSLAAAITEALRVTLGIGDRTRRERGLTEDLPAYELYLLGRHRWASRSTESLHAAIRYYREAIERDSAFALAHSGLADAYVLLPLYDPSVNTLESLGLARAAATRALELSPDRAEVVATAAHVAYNEWRFEEARTLVERAIAQAPSYVWAHHYQRQILGSLADYPGSLRAARRAHEIDPLSPVVVQGLATSLVFVDSLAAALPLHEEVANSPDPAPYWINAHASLLMELGREAEAERVFERWAQAMGYAHPERARVLATPPGEGTEETARDLLDDIAATTRFSRADIALLYTAAGADPLIEALEEVVAGHDFWALWMNAPGVWRVMRGDPRYLALLERVGLPPGPLP